MVLPPGTHPAAPRDSDLRRTFPYVARFACPKPVQGKTENARKDGHIRGRSKWFVHNAGWPAAPSVSSALAGWRESSGDNGPRLCAQDGCSHGR